MTARKSLGVDIKEYLGKDLSVIDMKNYIQDLLALLARNNNMGKVITTITDMDSVFISIDSRFANYHHQAGVCLNEYCMESQRLG